MIRTQINLPEPLHKHLKGIAERHDWSLAEVIRRASELYAARFPVGRLTAEQWSLPDPIDLGEALIDPADFRVKAEMLVERAAK